MLARVLGSTVGFWLRREANYKAGLERIKEKENFQQWFYLPEKFPVKEIMNGDFIPKYRFDEKHKPKIVNEFLRFFGRVF